MSLMPVTCDVALAAVVAVTGAVVVGAVVVGAVVVGAVVLTIVVVLVVALETVPVVVLTVTATIVLVVVVATVLIVGATGAALQLAIVSDEQSLFNKFLIRPNSLWSIDKFQRALTEIQSPR